ncbi:MAG: hypothetical protein RBU29_14040, partial [bacterium]|nr:hypothetical protein [bacterium]
SVVYLPFYHLGSALQPLFPGQDADWVRRKCLCWMNTVLTGLTVGLLALVVWELGYGRRAQIGLPLLYGFSTLAFVYARYDYNKCLAGLFLLLSFFWFLRFLRGGQARDLFFTGLAVGLLAMVRLELAGIALVYLIALVWREGTLDQKIKQGLLLSVPILLGGLFVYFYNRVYWSGELAGGYEGGMRLSAEGLLGFLFSPGKNLWVFNPILLLLPLALRPFFQAGQRAVVWAGVVLVSFLLYAFWGNWWGGWGYGPRHLVPLIPLLVLPLSALLDRKDPAILRSMAMLGLLGLGVQWAGAGLDFNDVLLTLQKAGIQEEEWIWNPAWNAVWQHCQFLQAVPLSRWDFAILAAWQSLPLGWFGFGFALWMGACYTVLRTGLDSFHEPLAEHTEEGAPSC